MDPRPTKHTWPTKVQQSKVRYILVSWGGVWQGCDRSFWKNVQPGGHEYVQSRHGGVSLAHCSRCKADHWGLCLSNRALEPMFGTSTSLVVISIFSIMKPHPHKIHCYLSVQRELSQCNYSVWEKLLSLGELLKGRWANPHEFKPYFLTHTPYFISHQCYFSDTYEKKVTYSHVGRRRERGRGR